MKRLDEYWYQRNLLVICLLPIAWVFCLLVTIRRYLYRTGILNASRLPVPVVIIGNISVGGSGKTPLLISLVELLKQHGMQPGVISRGYGGKATHWPQQVREDSDPRIVGDEPLMIARNCHVPIAVGPDRVLAAQQLLQHHACNIILSDDGMQHYALKRDIEIAVVDGIRRYGNGYCLPAGPLREPVSRLSNVDFIIANGLAQKGEYSMHLSVSQIINMDSGEVKKLDEWRGKEVNAIAGIGRPERFFFLLKQHGITIQSHPFDDHHDFIASNLVFDNELPIVMTEKDAVKCQRFAHEDMWYIPAQTRLDEQFIQRFLTMVKKVVK